MVIGAGFAGCVAARELQHRAVETVVVEARGRLGGRAYCRSAWGRQLELGGQALHWMQPHIWSEVTRYGSKIYDRPQIDTTYVLSNGEVQRRSSTAVTRALSDALDRLYDGASQLFDRPYEPLRSPDLPMVDQRSIGDALAALQLPADVRDAVDGSLSVNFNAPCQEGALTQGMRRVALASGSAARSAEAVRWRIRGGIDTLVAAIAEDARCEVLLDQPVAAVEQNGDRAVVHLRSGGAISARAIIVTVPIPTLAGIEFRPALSPGKTAFVAEGLVPRGVMLWARLRAPLHEFQAWAPGDRPLVYLRSDGPPDGGEGLVVQAFGPDAKRLCVDDKDAVQSAVRQWLPEAVVDDVAGHDWVADEFSRGTWAMLRPGQLTRRIAEIQRPERLVHFAGSDYAKGWAGYFDGAIESAITVARTVRSCLG